MIAERRTAKSLHAEQRQALCCLVTASRRGMELALHRPGFQHNLKMRLATRIQGDAESQQKHHRGEKKSAHQTHETSSDLSRGPDEISQHFALAAQATNDAVRVWTVETSALSWLQGLDTLLGYTPSPATSEIGFWQKQLHP